jgi:hypothetical protein
MPEGRKFDVEEINWVVFGKTDKPPKELLKSSKFYIMQK